MKAALYAGAAHDGQCVPNTSTPFIERLAAIARTVKDEPEEVVAAVWLSAVCEYAGVSTTALEAAGFPRPVVTAAFLLGIGRDPESMSHVKGNPIARRAAIAIIKHDLAYWSLDQYSTWDIFKRASHLHYLLMEPSVPEFRDYRKFRVTRPNCFTEAFPPARG